MEDCFSPKQTREIYRFLTFLFFTPILLFTAPALTLASENPESLQQKAPDSIEGEMKQRDKLVYDPERRSLFPEFYYNLRKKRLDWWQKHRVDFTLTYDVLAQGYEDPDESLGGVAGDLSLSGRWLIFGQRFNKPVYLNFRFRDRRAYSDNSPSDINNQTDLLWGTTNGFNDSGFQIPDMYFHQELYNKKLILRYGQFSIDKFVDKHSLRSAKRFFLNEAFSDNPTVNFPSYGAGFTATFKPNENWDFVAGGSNIQGTEGDKEIDFGFDSSALFWTVQAACNFTWIGDKNGRLQFMGWEGNDNQESDYEDGNGFSVTLEHDGVAEGETYVARYAHSRGDPTDTDTLFFLGYNRKIRGFDSLGLGISAGQSSASSDWQTVIEGFYRWQITKELLLTPDLQVILGDDLDGDSKTRFVGGVRVGIVF